MAKSKYEPLKTFLSESGQAEIPMAFEEIEAIIGCKLPSKASGYPAWWSNNPSNNPMTRAWLDAGYKSERVDTKNCKLIFRQQVKGTHEIELWVGGKRYRDDTGDDGPLRVAFKGRLLAGNDRYRDGFDLPVEPEISVYQTRTGKLVVHRDWREQRGDEEGATYLTFPDVKALRANPHALAVDAWTELDARDGVELPDPAQWLLRQVAEALGEPLVIRID